MYRKIILDPVRTGLLSCGVRLTVALLIAMVHAGLQAGPLSPLDYASLGTLDLTGGSYTIDTDALTITNDSAPGTPLFTGVIDDQGGQADSYGPGAAVTTVGTQGIPHIAVFTFDSINIAAAVNLTITGHRALALLSHGDATINADLDLSGENNIGQPNTTALRGGPGGFDGGTGNPPTAGSGPGGGGFNSSAGHATDASGDLAVALQDPGVAYGDLNGALQGGSGGGGNNASIVGNYNSGGGGGGALEIAASGIVDLGGTIDVRGGYGYPENGLQDGAGHGSAGAVRITAGTAVMRNGSILAGWQYQLAPPYPSAGRVYLAEGVLTYPNALNLNTSGIDLDSQRIHGTLTLVPTRTLVIPGHTITLATGPTLVQAATTSQPRIETVQGRIDLMGGDAQVPTGGTTLTFDMNATSLSSDITGAPGDVLTLDANLAGSATVSVQTVVNPGASINVGAGNAMAFSEPLTNNGDMAVFSGAFSSSASVTNTATGTLAASGATLNFPGDGVSNDDGLVNLGTLNLINTTVNGDVRSPAGSNINVAGATTFNGLVSGAGTFSGTTNLVTFSGGYSPGDSPAAISFGGDVAFTPSNALLLEIQGLAPGSGYDQVNVAGNLQAGGSIDLAVDPGLALSAGDSFTLLSWQTRAGEFAGISGIQQGNNLDLGVRYDSTSLVVKVVQRGDVNDDGQVDSSDLAIITANLGMSTSSYFSGDVDGNGIVDMADSNLVTQAIAGAFDLGDLLICFRIALDLITPDATQMMLCDVITSVNGLLQPDGQVDAADLVLLQKGLLGL